MKKIFLIGSPFCGSTVVGNILNSHKDILHAGEVDRLRLFSRYQGNDAYLTVDGCALCDLHHGLHCPIWDDLPNALQTPQEAVAVYEELTARAGKPVVVDSSKNVDWLGYLHDYGLQDAVAVVLSRNPFAFARSHHKAVHAPYWCGVEAWRNIYNHALRALIHRGIPFIALQHSAMLETQAEFFSKILKFAELEGELDYNRYFEVEAHAIGGNVGAFIHYTQFNKAKYFERELRQNRPADEEELAEKGLLPASPCERKDTAWLDCLTEADIDAGLSIPGVIDVMTLLGYTPASLVSMKIHWDQAQHQLTQPVVA